jgi:hypothetical protein
MIPRRPPPILLALALLAATGCDRAAHSPEPAPVAPVPGARAPRSAGATVHRPPGGEADPDAPSPEDAGPAPIRFRDATAASGITFVHTSGDDAKKHFPTANGSGVALLDFDGDGVLDVYLATTRELPLDAPTKSQGNRLYRGRGDGTFVDVTEAAGVGFHGFTGGLAVGDVDNNGATDLFLANLGRNVLYLNNGDGTFRDATANLPEGPAWSSSAAFLDYDADGALDLYVSCYGVWSIADDRFCGDEPRGVRTYCSPQLIPTTRHYLYKNNGDGTFRDATREAGVYREDGRGMGVLAADIDDDGHIDLYVANDLCPKFLFRNKGDGTFEDISEFSGAAASEAGAYQAGMGVDAEDVDGDGRIDLFATHFRNDYNTLYRNLGGGNFQDVSALAGVVKDSMPDVGWGCALADLDNDGLHDILVVNGHVDNNLHLLNLNEPQAERPKVWHNAGGGKFRLVSDPGPFFNTPHVARGAAFGDLDNDGDTDAIVCRLDAPPAVLLNESPPKGWLGLKLVGTRSNRSAVGARVTLRAGGRSHVRQLKGGGSYMSANDPRLLFGLGAAAEVESVEVRWPRGGTTTLSRPAINQYHVLEEPRDGATPPAASRVGPP